MNTLNRNGMTIAVMTILLILGGVAAYVTHREHRIQLLFLQAAGYQPFFRSTEQAQSAIRELAAYRGKEATQKLLAIAAGDVPMALPQVQVEAIAALERRSDSSTSDVIADLLQPSQSYPTREAAATALQRIPCNTDCVSAILHYLERVWQGDLNYEERTIFPGKMGESIQADAARDNASLYGQLLSVLQREHGTTLRILDRTYGLDSIAPSKFALMVVARAGFHDVCPLLMRDKKDVDQTAPWFVAPRGELATAIGALNCQ